MKNSWVKQSGLVGMFLLAIILADLSSAKWGPRASIINAFLFIGLDLSSRDRLHEAWNHNGLIWKMALLIASGSLISYAINHSAGRIAVASFVAFMLAAIVDTLTYQFLHRRAYLVKVNGSNIFSALVDSLTFPTIAFGGFLPLVTLGQFAAKVIGGAIWAYILMPKSINKNIQTRWVNE